MTRTEITQHLHNLVQEKNLTHAGLAKKLGMSRASVTQSLSQPTSNRDGTRVKIAEFLGLSVVEEFRIEKN